MSIRWIKDGEPHSAEVYNRPLRDYIQDAETTFAKQSLNIEVSNGLSGGGKLVGDKITIVGNDASTQQKGVVRFATLAEANEGTPGVVVSPDVVKEMGVGLGMGQRWYNLTAERRSDVKYINDTGRPIFISVTGARGRDSSASITVDGIMVGRQTDMWGEHIGQQSTVSAIIPNGSEYSATGGNRYVGGFSMWAELR